MSTGVYDRPVRVNLCVNCNQNFNSRSSVAKYCSRHCGYKHNDGAEYHKEWRANNPDKVREIANKQHANHSEDRNEYNKQWRKDNPIKAKAHDAVRKARKEGLVNQPCEVCGEKAHGHHENYEKPLELTWLCPSHHQQRHIAIRALKHG